MTLGESLLHHSGFRPRFRRRGSKDSGRSSKSDTSDDEGSAPIPNIDALLDDNLPEEYFKTDTLGLIHKLRISGWSSVQGDMAEHIEISKVSGALTNNVYRVSAPPYVKDKIKRESDGRHHKVPPTLLLRVYGLQADSLIDRAKELHIMEVLTSHNIGPKMLGTFTNGRFEQFLNAKPLTKEDLRNKETSIQIAKRMRDLHDHIPIPSEERKQGPLVFLNLNKWSKMFSKRLTEMGDKNDICSPEVFIRDVHKYMDFIKKKYKHVNKDLVFCHNDTQYGNILRVEPPKGSPLLQPQNEHRRLVVIDFEYSGPNTRAYDIANHFCEWMSNYDDPVRPHHIWRSQYPTREEQLVFLNSYVEHGAAVLDEVIIEKSVNELLLQIVDWLPAVSAFWAMWGVIQAPYNVDSKIQQLEQAMASSGYGFKEWEKDPPQNVELEVEEDFDYFAYSKEKMDLFYTDCKTLGIF